MSRPHRHAHHIALAQLLALGTLAPVTSCAMDTGDDSPFNNRVHHDGLGETSQSIINGQDGHRRELVQFNGGCTGTLLGARWVLTAAHCWNWQEAVNDPLAPDPNFVVRTSTDGRSWGSNGGDTYRIDRLFVMDRDTLLGAPDVMLARLATPVPSSFLSTFPPLSTAVTPGAVWVTIWGQGCTAWGGPGAGTMRFFEYRRTSTSSTSSALCPGDSGGPARFGHPYDEPAAIWGVNSASFGGTDAFGAVATYRDEIMRIMSRWDTIGASRDIAEDSRFCPGGELFWADINGDGAVEAICRDMQHQTIRTSKNTERKLFVFGGVSSSYCTAANGEMHVGDVNGDGRTDIVCRDPSQRSFELLVADEFGRYSRAWSRNDVGFCTHAQAKLFTGDFNGDGLTDLLCKDPGAIWFDFATAGGQFDFITGWHEFVSTAFCTHDSATLFVGDFNGDRRTDLLCMTANNGDIQIELAAASGIPFDGIINDWSYDGPGDVCRRGDTLQVMDADGDGRSDLYCRQAGTGSTWPSLRARNLSPIFDYSKCTNPGGCGGVGFGDYMRDDWFGWGRSVRPRGLHPASQPSSGPRTL